jgi:hypothetical protein
VSLSKGVVLMTRKVSWDDLNEARPIVDDKKFNYDEESRTFTIYGIKYHEDFFKNFGELAFGSEFKIIKHEDGVVMLERSDSKVLSGIKIVSKFAGETLIIKFDCLFSPETKAQIQKDLQDKLGQIKIVVLPDAVDFE